MFLPPKWNSHLNVTEGRIGIIDIITDLQPPIITAQSLTLRNSLKHKRLYLFIFIYKIQ